MTYSFITCVSLASCYIHGISILRQWRVHLICRQEQLFTRIVRAESPICCHSVSIVAVTSKMKSVNARKMAVYLFDKFKCHSSSYCVNDNIVCSARTFCLSAGSSSVVYKAWDVENLRFVAIKRVSVFQQAKRKQVARELHSLQRLGECHQIIGFHGAYYEEGNIFPSIVLKSLAFQSKQNVAFLTLKG